MEIITNIVIELVKALGIDIQDNVKPKKIAFHVVHQLEKRLQEKGFIFEEKKEFIYFCNKRLTMSLGYDADEYLDIEIYIDNKIYLTNFHETYFLVYL